MLQRPPFAAWPSATRPPARRARYLKAAQRARGRLASRWVSVSGSLRGVRFASGICPGQDFIAAIANGLAELVEAGTRAYETPFLDSAHRLAEKVRHLLFVPKRRALTFSNFRQGLHLILFGSSDEDDLRLLRLICPASAFGVIVFKIWQFFQRTDFFRSFPHLSRNCIYVFQCRIRIDDTR